MSFNGGKGGIAAKPTSQQVAFAKERHVEATPIQRRHVEKAGKDQALFAKQNQGEPAVAATPRAGVFQGAGVSRGSRTPVASKSNDKLPSTGAEKSGPAVNKETPKVEEHKPSQPKAEERKPAQAQPKAEERRPTQGNRRPKSEGQLKRNRRPKSEGQFKSGRRPKSERQFKRSRRPKTA